MELRDIEYFAVIAEHRHLGRAADALGLTHPALSKSLRRLERAVQAKLVQRTAKGVDLTPEGHALLAHVRGLRISLADVTREIAALSQGRAGHLRIGTGPGVEPHLVPSVCGALLREGTRATFKIRIMPNDLLIVALRNGELDLIVGGIPAIECADLVQEALYADELAVVAAKDHPLAGRLPVALADLANEAWALSTENVAWHALHRMFDDHRLPPPRVALESNSISIRLHAVTYSRLLSFGPKRFTLQAARRLPLKLIAVKDVHWPRVAGVSYRKDAYLSALARRFVQLLQARARALDD